MPVTAYSTTPSSNNSAVPNGAPEGMAPSGVNDVIRQVMADIAVEAQTNNVKVLKSVTGTNTITADMDPELGAYVAGTMVVLTPANTNSGATTLAIDGLTALDVFKIGGVALASGDLVAGHPAMLVLDSGADDFILLNPQATFCKIANNLSDVTASTARTNLGITATGADTTYCYRANNLSDVTASTARTNLDVPTRTGGNASGSWGISVTGSSASCTGNAATATTATSSTTQSAGNNSTLIATTAFVKDCMVAGEDNLTQPANSINTDYTNTTGRTIFVSYAAYHSTINLGLTGEVNTSTSAQLSILAGFLGTLYLMVPNGAVYRINCATTPESAVWTEQ